MFTPADHAGSDLPVYVWFPGGGFVRGSVAEPTYDARVLAGRGAVVVTVNYRLGVFGFMAHPELTRESPHGASGNYGLLDCIAALAWVRDNISAFGGDPRRVTISGQSAGGAVVGNLMVSPLAKGLFQRVIAMSPGSFRLLATLADSEKYGLEIGKDIKALRQLDAKSVLAFNAKYVPKARGLTTPRILRPIVDGWVLPEQEMDMFLAGRFAQVPLIVGTCDDEGSMLAVGSQMASLAQFKEFMQTNFGTHVSDALAVYPATNDQEVLPAYEGALADTQFHYAARSMARVYSKVEPNTYRYFFTRQTGGMTRPAQHCDELPYIFGTLEDCAITLGLNPPNEAEFALAEVMQDAWVRFMATGNPNGGKIKDWPKYDPESDESMEFGKKIKLTKNIRRPQMDMLDRTYGLFQ